MHKHIRSRKITGTGGKGKTTVVGVQKRGGTVRATVVESRKKPLQTLVKGHVEPGAHLFADALVDSSHPLVGTWIEEENPFDTTAVVYTIVVRAGRFRVSGVDESDGVSLRISNTTWDGERLRFVTFFPPTQHEATHEFWVTRKGRARHKVTYSDGYRNHTINEVWKKRA